jgi:hypothetical protein
MCFDDTTLQPHHARRGECILSSNIGSSTVIINENGFILINAVVVQAAHSLDQLRLVAKQITERLPKDSPSSKKPCKTVLNSNTQLGEIKVEGVLGLTWRMVTRKGHKHVV